MIVNMNHRVRVTLTKTGERLLREHWAQYGTEDIAKTVAAELPVYETQLWCLMQEFGDGIHMGMGEVPFEGNNVEFLPEP